MADFVNYNKRSIDLPPGCKDLIDVLRAHGERRPRKLPVKATVDEQSENAWCVSSISSQVQLSDIGDHVEELYRSGDRRVLLLIESPDFKLTAVLHRMDEEMTAGVKCQQGSEHEVVVRNFLSKRGLNPRVISVAPDSYLISQISPLPSKPAELTQLMADFFHNLGFDDNSPMLYEFSTMLGSK